MPKTDPGHPSDVLRNGILAGLPKAEWAELRKHATLVSLPAGHTLRRPGERFSTVLFPDCGIVSVVDVLASGHNVEIAAIGRNGLVGLGAILDLQRAPVWFIVQVAGSGYQVPSDVFARMFHESEALRRSTLGHAGRLMAEFARSAACNRFHSHRERLARWLVVTARRSGTSSLELTHEFIAQMVGGPRHAVTAALAHLRAKGAIEYQRGRIDILDEVKLMDAACECAHSGLTRVEY